MSERNTIQKQVILNTLKAMQTHPSVDELYTEVVKVHPTISKTTVYRNINQLTQKGSVYQVAVINDIARYDGCLDTHYHFICDECSSIFDIYPEINDNSEDVLNFIEDEFNFSVKRSMTSFYGVCDKCRS